MQLILQLGCSQPFCNEVPNNLYLLLCTRLKTLWVMEDKVASFICDLMLNIMYSSLMIQCNQSISIVNHWLTSIDGIKWVSEGFSLLPRRNKIWETVHVISFNLPSSSYMMMGCVPFATPQTFSRMVVLPALALPMTRMRKCGHLYCFLSTVILSTGATIKNQSISFSGGEERILQLTHQMQVHQESLTLAIFSHWVRWDGLYNWNAQH